MTQSDRGLEEVRRLSAEFVDQRRWRNYQTPKNLSMALAVEAAELLEHFQWMSEEQSLQLNEAQMAGVREEMADVLVYLCRMADVLDVDLTEAAVQKIRKNHEKYPPPENSTEEVWPEKPLQSRR